MDTKVIVPVKNSKAFLVSAYLDERFSPRMLRIISIVDQASWTQFYCHFCNGSKAISTRAEVAFHPENFGFPYSTADILCQVPLEAGVVSSVSVTVGLEPYPGSPFLPIRSLKRVSSGAFHRNFTVCISTLFGNYSNVLQFVQSLEMYRILGAQKVLIYKSDCSSILQKVLDYYSSEGLVEVIAWNIHHHLNVSKSWKPSLDPGDVHYYGQITALNDCVYRNMGISRYVVLNDIDEVVVPVLHNNWADMMSYLSMGHLGTESFFFENNVFRHRVVGDDSKFDLWADVPGVNILRHVHREPLRFLAFNARKMIVNPRAVVRISVHKVPWQMGARLRVPGSVARLHHCRNDDDLWVRDSELIRDTSLWKYSAALIKNVNCVISHVLKS
ncbi:hypothetical protein Z043_123956 [Scleropages formosus]|uniref:Glycosyltransferase family 92 protein n=1 Tax=Scleropages formosus TaxID=113540 RepID=A0A0P7UCY0_SCLFO|nr:hypothetical protein Z043_123956 [Scleropages formosus]